MAKKANSLSAALGEAEQWGNKQGRFMESRADIVGPELPFPLAYLFGINVFPLGKIVGIAGHPASLKSTLGFALMRLVRDYNGEARLMECEGGKYSIPLMSSVMGPDYDDWFKITECTDIDEAQDWITKLLDLVGKHNVKDEILGVMIDSLTGSIARESSEKISKEGHAGREFPIEALLWSKYFKKLSASLLGRPVAFIFINHIKEKPSERPGLPNQEYTPGGAAQDFHSAMFIYMKAEKKTKELVTWEVGIPGSASDPLQKARRTTTIQGLHLKTHKNSLGAKNRMLSLECHYYYDEENRLHTYFDWDGALANLVAEHQDTTGHIQGVEGSSGKLSELLRVSVNSNRYSCSDLGASGVMAHTLGKAIRAQPALYASLLDFFHIEKYPIWGSKVAQ
jgi:hypothetical protein